MAHGTLNRQATQHRPSREAKLSRRERELESEVKHLTRQLAKARKALSRAEGGSPEAFEEEDEPFDQPPSTKPPCPNCEGELDVHDLGFKVFLICSDCKFRKAA